jgi:hypothetical protein
MSLKFESSVMLAKGSSKKSPESSAAEHPPKITPYLLPLWQHELAMRPSYRKFEPAIWSGYFVISMARFS